MIQEARNQKLEKRIKEILENYEISNQMSYSLQEKDGVYQCVIKYQKKNNWNSFWISTGCKVEKGNQRNANKVAQELFYTFRNIVKEHNSNVKTEQISFIDFQELVQLNTTNYNPKKKTKADWDFYEYMEYWLYNIIKQSVEKDTFSGYRRQVTGRLKEYFTDKKYAKKVKEITAEDLDDFYSYLRNIGLQNSTIDHYNDNISSAFKYLVKKKLVRYNPTELINPIVVERKEVQTYTKEEIKKLFDILKGDTIELPTMIDGYYGLRRSEIIGLRKQVFDFENNNFVINHVAIQNDGKENEEKIYFKDKAKSKKGYRTFPLFEDVKEEILKKLERIEENKIIFGNTYNHKYDGYIFVHDNGDIIQPNYFTKRFKKIVEKKRIKKNNSTWFKT